ncbi:MAG TPA: hypothetical protein ENI62_02175 [Gammaproteobacteria bacterium]|nr:hypothetical protein [Gammaproteobacteria bacterium]
MKKASTVSVQSNGISPQLWRSLYYFNLYRMVLAGVLLTVVSLRTENTILGGEWPQLFLASAVSMALMSVMNLLTISLGKPDFTIQARLQFMMDLLLLVLLMHSSGGISSGIGLLLVVSVAGSGVVHNGRQALFFAAVASLLVLLEQTLRSLQGLSGPQGFTAVGLMGVALFATALAIYGLAERSRSSAKLAQQRALDLAELRDINELVIEHLDTGVLILDHRHNIHNLNRQARELLQVQTPVARLLPLRQVNLPLADALDAIKSGASLEPILRLQPQGRPVAIRRLNTSFGPLVFLDDVDMAHTRAQQMKLAGLGRLSAAIAHEIRNPLSAITHAAELLAENEAASQQDQRLVSIIREQSDRIDHIIESVLFLGRQQHPQQTEIALATWLRRFAATFCDNKRLPRPALQIIGQNRCIQFNSEHLRQIILNLCNNALMHGIQRQADEAIIILEISKDQASSAPRLTVSNPGNRLPPNTVEHLFEPFFTTHRKGTGLGLYLCRELCEANAASLRYLDSADDLVHFRIQFPLTQPSTSTLESPT